MIETETSDVAGISVEESGRTPRVMHPNTALALAKSRPRRRGIKQDYAYYDPPETIYRYITEGKHWNYRFRKDDTQLLYLARDMAAMSLEYLATFRATEMVRGATVLGDKGSILSTQFNFDDPNWLRLRDAIIIKHFHTNKKTKITLEDKTLEDMPRRVELKFPRTGDLAKFTRLIEEYLSLERAAHPRLFANGMELFKIKRHRLYVIVNMATGKGPHYLRAQGLKLMSYLMTNNLANLKRFSGHSQISTLLLYLSDVEYEKAMLSYKTPEVAI